MSGVQLSVTRSMLVGVECSCLLPGAYKWVECSCYWEHAGGSGMQLSVTWTMLV